MADSKETIKASMTAPTHRVVDGVKVDLTAEEAEAILDEWVDNEHARQVDEDANGYKTNRAKCLSSDCRTIRQTIPRYRWWTFRRRC